MSNNSPTTLVTVNGKYRDRFNAETQRNDDGDNEGGTPSTTHGLLLGSHTHTLTHAHRQTRHTHTYTHAQRTKLLLHTSTRLNSALHNTAHERTNALHETLDGRADQVFWLRRLRRRDEARMNARRPRGPHRAPSTGQPHASRRSERKRQQRVNTHAHAHADEHKPEPGAAARADACKSPRSHIVKAVRATRKTDNTHETTNDDVIAYQLQLMWRWGFFHSFICAFVRW